MFHHRDKTLVLDRDWETFKNDRCDILYHCINFDSSIGEDPINFLVLQEEGVLSLRVAYPPVKAWYVKNIKQYNNMNYVHRFPTTMVSTEVYLNLVQLCSNSSPNTGTIAIYDLFQYNPSSLTIRGITMFSGGYNTNYRSKIVTEKEVRDLNAKAKNHDIEKQKLFLRQFLKKNDIIIDNNLRESIYGKA